MTKEELLKLLDYFYYDGSDDELREAIMKVYDYINALSEGDIEEIIAGLK